MKFLIYVCVKILQYVIWTIIPEPSNWQDLSNILLSGRVSGVICQNKHVELWHPFENKLAESSLYIDPSTTDECSTTQ